MLGIMCGSRKVLMSIKPEYASRILSGTKKYEFRKRLFSANVKKVEIYSSSPIKRVVGSFKIKTIHNASPVQLWKKCSHAAGIDEDSFFRYFAGSDVAYAIEIESVKTYATPRSISEFGKLPPQSYCYIR